MPVDLDGVAAEGTDAFDQRFDVADGRHGAVALLTVGVHHGAQPVETVVGGERERFPGLTLLEFTVGT